MSNLVIVAIPDENDRVWKVSSEKIPHLTLLHLGDSAEVANLDQIVLFTEHAANTTLRRFYLPVDRRGELGDAKADVLFFKKGRYDYKAVRDFRVALLKDNNIRTAHDSVAQFEGVWQPHLTLGYPATPAKPDDTDRDFGFYDVAFNKIAVWPDNFEGPEFLLKDYWDEWEALETVPMDVAMSDIRHFGVKGMKWGVRKENLGSAAKSVGTAAKSAGGAVGKAAGVTSRFVKDVQFENRVETGEARERVMSASAKPFRKEDLPAVKARHGDYAKLHNRAKKPFSKEARAYRKDAKETYIKRLETTANSMTNASGNRQYTIRERGWDQPAEGGSLPASKNFWDVSSREVKHAAADLDFTRLEVIMDDEGYITDLKQVEVEDAMAQTADLGAAFLAHVGVKGMRWGVRKEEVGGGGHIRISNRNNQASLSTRSGVAVVGIGPFAFLSPRVRNEVKAAQAHNKNVKGDKKWKKQIDKSKKGVEVHNTAADEINSKLPAFNGDKRWKDANGKDIDLPSNPAKQKEYDDAATRELINPAYANAAVKVYGSKSPSERYTFEVHDAATGTLKLNDALKVKHAADDEDPAEMTVRFSISRDSNGRILGFTPEDEENMAHSAFDLGAEFILEHYGVKGMHWGQRKAPPTAVAPTASSVVPHGAKRKTKIEVAGGENHPASEDAVKVAQARVKLQKSGAASLSNKELQDVANRIELEQRVKRATQSGTQKFVSNLLKNQGQQSAQQLVSKGAKKGAKKAFSFG